jgi:hypothetical protein
MITLPHLLDLFIKSKSTTIYFVSSIYYVKVKTQINAVAFEYEKSAHLAWLQEKFIDLAINVIEEVEGVGQIQHFIHQHDLILRNEDINATCTFFKRN